MMMNTANKTQDFFGQKYFRRGTGETDSVLLVDKSKIQLKTFLLSVNLYGAAGLGDNASRVLSF